MRKKIEQMSNDEVKEPDEFVSNAFINFMHRRSEISEFVRFYHRLAKRAVERDSGKSDNELYNEYRGQSTFFLENYICRVFDLFEIYLDELVFAVAVLKNDFLSEALVSKAKAKLEELGFEQATQADVLFEAANSFGRRGRTEIAQLFQQKLGFDMIAASRYWDDTEVCSAIRNLIVHKGSTMDERFCFTMNRYGVPFDVAVGAPLLMSEPWILKLASRIHHCICAIDSSISSYAKVHKRSRLGHFWLPRSTWANPLNDNPTQERN